MTSPYENQAGAKGYLDFLDSPDGATFKKILSENILRRLEGKNNLSVLDAGCGPGWLSKMLSDLGHSLKACDISPQLIEKAQNDYPGLDFKIADLTEKLPYEDNTFDCVILSLSALDLKNLRAAYGEIKRVMNNSGRLIIVTVNPYYGFPVGVWKRGLVGRLLLQKPALKLRPYFSFKRKADRAFTWNGNLTSYFYTLPEQINLLLGLGFNLKFFEDLESAENEKKYSLKFRLYRFPVFVLMEFAKNSDASQN